MKTNQPVKKSVLAITAILATLAAGCGDPHRQAPQSSGFLGTYAELKPMPGRRQALFYENPEAKWDQYTQILIEPVRILSRESADQQSMSLRDRRMLGTYFEVAMREMLQTKYHVVTQPAPGVLRIRAAITNISSGDALVNQVSKTIVHLPGGFGQVTLEGELVDSVTGERLVAIVDGRAGSLFESYKDWEDVTGALDEWSQQLFSILHGHIGDIPLDTTQHAAAKPAVPVAVSEPVAVAVVAAAVTPEAEVKAAPEVIAPVVVAEKPKPKPKPKAKPKPKPKPAAVAEKAKPKPKPKPVVVAEKAKPKPKPEPVVVAKKAAPKPAPKVEPVVEPPKPVVVAKVAVVEKPAPKAEFDPWQGKPGTGSANINERDLRPFILGIKTEGDLQAVAKAAKKRLKSNGLDVVGSYSPQTNTVIIVATNKTMKQHAAKSEYGGYGAAVRISVTKMGDEVQVSYTNPNYLNAIYRMKGSLSGIAGKLATALGKTKTFGSKEGIKDSDLRDWHYMFGMPYFDDPIELAEHDSYQAAVNKVASNLKSGTAGLTQVYRIDIPGKEETVFGVAISQGKGADQTIMSTIDVEKHKHTAHLPYELLVSGDTVYTLNGKFRIAISFPDLTMGQFVEIRDAPDQIEGVLKKASN